MICIGNQIFTKITGDMLLEVPEGTYAITVANKGYGGTGTYTVARGETTLVDLDQLKGSGPKVCQLTVTSEVHRSTLTDSRSRSDRQCRLPMDLIP